MLKFLLQMSTQSLCVKHMSWKSEGIKSGSPNFNQMSFFLASDVHSFAETGKFDLQ